MKNLRYRLEYFLLLGLSQIFKALPWRTASSFGGFLGRVIGRFLPASKKARKHLTLCFPDMTEKQKSQHIRGMWDNLGRVVAEYPHIRTIVSNHIRFENEELLSIYAGRPCIFVSAHLANWELLPCCLLEKGFVTHSFYRSPNNPYVADLLERYRTPYEQLKTFEKSPSGVVKAMKALKKGECLGMLIDQKFNKGIESNFFGHLVRTSTAFAELAHKLDCPIIIGYVERTKDNFVIHAEGVLESRDDQGQERPIKDMVDHYHAELEKWIKRHPEQWLWIHRRWRGI